MTLDDLTVNFAHLERESLLSDWVWLIGAEKLPTLLAASGDAFVQDRNNGSVHWLDSGEANLEQVATNQEEFSELLTNKEFVVEYLAVQMIGDLIHNGKELKKGQIYSLSKPYILGGEYSLENIEPTNIEVHFSILGQIHNQVRNLPKGTPATSITIK